MCFIDDALRASPFGLSLYLASLVANRLPVKPSEGVKANMAMLHGGPAIPGNRDRDLPISMVRPHAAPALGSTPTRSHHAGRGHCV